MNKKLITRRKFIQGTVAAAATVMIIPSRALAGPNGRLNIACIGCGGKGDSDVKDVGGENVVALCDVDEKISGAKKNQFPKAKVYTDYRKMLDEMGREIDAVTVSTPDHNHFPASMMAIRMGKHVFCQKPLTHNIHEARMLTYAARKHKVSTQMGIQGHSNQGPRRLCEWVESGVLGQVREVHYWTNRPIWPQGMERPGGTKQIPSHFHWDEWLGPAPERPYNDGYAPFSWRGWWDFGCGALGDIGCHAMDAAFWALKLGTPTLIESESSGVNDETAPRWSIVTYQFSARANYAPVKVIWHDGGKRPEKPKDLEDNRDLAGDIGGQLLFGDKATVMGDVYGGSFRIIPETKMRSMMSSLPPKRIPNSIGHVPEWIAACKGGAPAGANFEFAGPLTEMVLLGNLSVRTGKPIEWDAEEMCVKNVPEANQFVSRQPRKGWADLYEDPRPKKKTQPKREVKQSTYSEKDKREAEADKLFRTAREAERFGQRSAAKGLYAKIVKDYAGTEAATKAADRLSKLGN